MRAHRALSAFVVVVSFAVSAAAQSRPVFTPDDLLAIRTFAGGQPVSAASTGEWLAYVLTDTSDEWNVQERRPTGYVHVQALGAQPGNPRALTTGAAHSSFPVWSPDGRQLAFVREENGAGQTMIWTAASGQARPIGDRFTARITRAPQWDRQGTTLFVAAMLPEEPVAPYRVRSVKHTDARIPGDQFFTNTQTARLVSIDVASGAATQLTPEPLVVRSFQVSPTGRHLLYVSPDPETLGVIGKERSDTFVLSLGAGGSRPPARKLTEGGRYSWAPDGRLLFSKAGRLMVADADGGAAARPWQDALTVDVGEPVWSPDGSRFAALVVDPSVKDPELEEVAPGMYTTARPFMDLYIVSADGASKNVTAAFPDQVSNPVWSADAASLFFRAVDNATYDETIYRYTVVSQQLEPFMRGAESYGRVQPVADGLIVGVEDATHPVDYFMVKSGNVRTRLTNLNPQLAKFAFSAPQMFSFHSADGDRLAALLYKPANLGANEKVPVITWVYEKLTPNVHRFNARDQMFISHGYAMLMPNVKIRVGRTADSFEKSVVPAVNAVRDMGFTNGKFAIWGHSFGAYATSTLISRTDIFAAAVSGATPPELFRNWASGRDRDTRNIETGQARMGGSPFEYPERYLSQSAFFHLDKVTTPVLILHGEKDLTILFGEGEMMFYALRQLGKTAELVAYANGDHSLSRHSRADALDVNKRILEWFARYLEPAAGARTQ